MIRSMTAFGRVSGTVREGGWVVEIRSLNNRYFDFSLKIPPASSFLESRIREKVQTEIKRGKVTLALTNGESKDGGRRVSLNEDAVRLYLGAIGKLKKKFKLKGEVVVGDLLRLPDIFTAESPDQDPEKIWPLLEKILKRVLDQAIQSKVREGRQLALDIEKRLQQITKAVQKIEAASKTFPETVFRKLKDRVQQLLDEKEKDEERLYREVAFLAERSDITEEVVRLRSHLELFQSRLKGNGEVGRELDFLCQEMNREINTMGSKSQLFEIATEVVFVKGELEKIREQIQNIE